MHVFLVTFDNCCHISWTAPTSIFQYKFLFFFFTEIQGCKWIIFKKSRNMLVPPSSLLDRRKLSLKDIQLCRNLYAERSLLFVKLIVYFIICCIEVWLVASRPLFWLLLFYKIKLISSQKQTVSGWPYLYIWWWMFPVQ